VVPGFQENSQLKPEEGVEGVEVGLTTSELTQQSVPAISETLSNGRLVTEIVAHRAETRQFRIRILRG